LSEVRWRLSRDEDLPARMRRLHSMEHTARIWVNGKELGEERPYSYLAAVHD
jgi:hypothetical protein